MRLLRVLAVATAAGAWLVIMVGGFTTASNSGAGCREAVICGGTPLGAEAAAVEGAHRVAAWAEGFLALFMLVLVLRRYRQWTPLRNLTVLAFALVVVQGVIGMLSVAAIFGDLGLGTAYPALVTAHLGVATAFLAVTVLNAAVVFRGPPPEPLGTHESRPTAADS
ncbi:MAG TPA: COX15/CtaA family protein [Thermoplasmata archaeon]|nr:COX15/CtaA family protein [Thermoplasmata archaeon]